MDPITSAATEATVAIGEESKKLLQRVLGPSADSVGGFLGKWLDIRTRNALRVAERADARRAANLEQNDRPVPMRVAMRIFDEAAYCDEDSTIVAEYLGGLLASARQTGSKSDLANSYAALISRLATEHLRFHYVIYKCIQQAYFGQDVNMYRAEKLASFACMIPAEVFEAAFPNADGQEIDPGSSLFWLDREGLLDTFSGAKHSRDRYPNIPEDVNGVVVKPNPIGVGLFMWGLGRPDSIQSFFQVDPDDFYINEIAVSFDGVMPLRS